jgi:geranylgeranyl diphosphate synthase, type I
MIDFANKWRGEIDRTILGFLKGDEPRLWKRARDYPGRGGKRIRPALVLLGAKEAGGSERDVLKLAAAVEIFHDFTLVHDDIEDSSDFRRGKPTLHRMYGIPLANNAGDGMHVKAYMLALEYGPEILKSFMETAITIMEGQEMDIGWSETDHLPSEKEYVEMIRRKTSVLLGFSLEAGYQAVAGRRNPALRKYAESLGVAFQIIDDILGAAGDTGKTGKDADKDIEEGKKNLPMIYAVRKHPEGKRVLELLNKDKRSREEVDFIKRAIRESGALDYCRAEARKWIGRAEYDFKSEEVGMSLEDFKKFLADREF